jgi:hypothetical protein
MALSQEQHTLWGNISKIWSGFSSGLQTQSTKSLLELNEEASVGSKHLSFTVTGVVQM